jgi:hypothetical protein
MPKLQEGALTEDKKQLLIIAAKVINIAKAYAAHPPLSTPDIAYWNDKVQEEMVCVLLLWHANFELMKHWLSCSPPPPQSLTHILPREVHSILSAGLACASKAFAGLSKMAAGLSIAKKSHITTPESEANNNNLFNPWQ